MYTCNSTDCRVCVSVCECVLLCGVVSVFQHIDRGGQGAGQTKQILYHNKHTEAQHNSHFYEPPSSTLFRDVRKALSLRAIYLYLCGK